MPYRKLRGRIIEKYGTYGKFAEALGKTKQAVSRKLTGGVEFTREDIIKWCELLDIEIADIGLFFYAQELNEV